jgi:hypothetical protein
VTFRRLLKEVAANLRSRPALTTATLLTALLLGFGSSAWEIGTTGEIQDQWELQLASGASTVRVVDASGDPLSGARCDALGGLQGVRAAGARVTERLVEPYGNQGAVVTIDEVTSGYVAVAFPLESDAQGLGVLAGREISSDYGLQNGGRFFYRTSPRSLLADLTVDRAATHESRIPGLGTAIFVVVASNTDVNECLVDIYPSFRASALLAISGWFDGRNVVIAPLLPSDSTRADPERVLRTRVTRFAGIGSGLVLAAWAMSLWWMRRDDLSLYRLLGVTYRQLLVMASVEVMGTLLLPFQIGVSLAIIANRDAFVPATLSTLPWDVFQAVPILALTPWLAIVPVRLANPLKILRER